MNGEKTIIPMNMRRRAVAFIRHALTARCGVLACGMAVGPELGEEH